MENWLQQSVGTAYDALKVNSERAITPNDVRILSGLAGYIACRTG